jgi:hypothetical protein
MTPTNNLTPKFKNVQAPQPLSGSEKFLIILFFILVAIFSISLTIIAQAIIYYFLGVTFEWSWLRHIFKILPFFFLSILFVGIISYFLRLTVVITKLFKGFWESLEGEE